MQLKQKYPIKGVQFLNLFQLSFQNGQIYYLNTNLPLIIKKKMKGKKNPQIIDLLESDQEKNQQQSNIIQPVFKYQSYNTYSQKKHHTKHHKYNYKQLDNLLEPIQKRYQQNIIKEDSLLEVWKKAHNRMKQKSIKKKKISEYDIPNSNQTIATSTYTNQPRPVEALSNHSKNPAIKHLQIYEFLRTNNIIPEVTTKASPKCKICNKLISEDAINYCFQCEKCENFCHFQCMSDTTTCPRCFYNWRISKFKHQSIQFNITNKNKQGYKNQPDKPQFLDISSNSNEEPKQNKENMLQMRLAGPQYKQQMDKFMNKYPKYINKKNNILLPIKDSLIWQTKFIRNLLQQKQIKLNQLPKMQDLPYYFGQIVQLWNFYRTFECMIQNKKICRYALQTFQQQLKNNQIHTFILPILAIILNSISLSNSKLVPILKLFQDLKNQNILQYLGKYFWTFIILQLIKNTKYKQQQQYVNMSQKMSLMFEKRIFLVDNFQQKLEIIKFVVAMAQKSTNFKSWISDSIKNHSQKIANVTQIISKQRQKIKIKQKQTMAEYTTIQQNLTTIKNNLIQNPMVVSKTLPSSSSITINEIKKLQGQKSQNIRFQEQLKRQTRELRQDIKTLQFVNEIQYTNKVTYLGKDRNKSLYWYIFGAESNDVIFKSTSSETKTKDINEQNQSIQQKKQILSNDLPIQKQKQKWGFYHGTSIEQLVCSLNSAGIQQSRLKKNIQNLLCLNLLVTSSSKKLSRTKSLYNELHEQEQQKQQQIQIQNCKQFLQNNIKQINLSQLRKLFLQTLKVFNNFVRKNVGIWRINKEYQQKIKEYKFKSLDDIKTFLQQFAKNMYSLKDDLNSKNTKGRLKRGCQLWINRLHIFSIWKSKLQSSTKNTEVFMYAIILYLQVVNTARKLKNPQKYNQSNGTYNYKKSRSPSSKSSSKAKSSSQIESWSGSHDNLMEVDSNH